MKDVACEDLLYHDHPSAVALSILCDFKDKDKQTVVNTILRRLRELTNGDELEYKNYLKKVNILSDNRDLQDEVEKGANMLSVNVEKIPFYRMGRKEGAKEATFDNAIAMMEKFNHSIDDMVKAFNIKKEELIEYMNKIKNKNNKES